MAAIIKAVQRTPKDEIAMVYVDYESGMARCVTFTVADASTLAAQLLDAVAGKEDAGIRAEIARLRRDQQQMLTALQEVARKVAKLDKMPTMTEVRLPLIHVGADITVNAAENAAAVAREFAGAIKTSMTSPREGAPC